jgi:polyribonucleotide nucleotidyltransferase
MGGGKRVNQVEDVLSLGDKVQVVVREIDDRGKVSLDLAEGFELAVPESAHGGSGDGGRDAGRDGGRDAGRDGGRDRERRDRGSRSSRDGGREGSREGSHDRDRGRDRQPERQQSDRPARTMVSFEDEFESGT